MSDKAAPIHHRNRAAFMIVGYRPSASPKDGVASLILAAYAKNDLRCVGSAEISVKERATVNLRQMMDKLSWRSKKPPVSYSGEHAVSWLQPTIIAEIEYQGWSAEGAVQGAVFKGLMIRQDNADVYQMAETRC
jgi:bifunctional non-homologous end joining protein LigD